MLLSKKHRTALSKVKLRIYTIQNRKSYKAIKNNKYLKILQKVSRQTVLKK